MPPSNKKEIELLLESILDIVNKLQQEVSSIDIKYEKEVAELKSKIQELNKIVSNQEFIEVLAKNISPEGLKHLIDDVKDNKDYRIKQIAMSEEAKKWIDRLWKIGIPVIMFLSGIAWFIIKMVLSQGGK